jgi:hypothetical protein
MASVGSDQQSLGAATGGVIDADGAMLLSTDTTGETSSLLGPAALREIQAGIANGDFAVPPTDPTLAISDANPLPYWTFTDVNSAGSITCSVVSDSAASSGNVLRWNIAPATFTTGKSASISRYMSVPSSRDRAFVFVPEAFLGTRVGTNFNVTLSYTWAKKDYTVTGTGDSATSTGSATLLAPTANPLQLAAPSDAAFIYVTLTIATTGTTSGTTTQDISEIRLHRGDQGLYITDTASGIYAPARITSASNVLKIEAATGDAYPISFKTGAAANNAIIVLGDGTTGGAIRAGSGTARIDMLSADQSAYGRVVADRFYPGSQTAYYLDAPSSYTGPYTNGSLNAAASINSFGAGFFNDTPATTSGVGQIAGEAMWILSSGTNYQLKRSTGTSWKRFKKNIEPTSITPEQFRQLDFVDFNWNKEAMQEQFPDLDYVAEERQHGLLLDQLVSVLPEAVQPPMSPTDTETIAWHTVYLAAMVALQDAIKRIEELEGRVAALESR